MSAQPSPASCYRLKALHISAWKKPVKQKSSSRAEPDMELTPAQWAALGSGLFLPFSTAKNGVSSCSLWGFVAQRLLHVLCHSSLGRHRPVRDCFHKLVDYLWDGSRVVEPLPVPRLYWCHSAMVVEL